MPLKAGRTRRKEAHAVRNLERLRLYAVAMGSNGKMKRVELVMNYLASENNSRDGVDLVVEVAEHFREYSLLR